MCKGMMVPEDLVITDLDGRKINGGRNASSELAMHLTIYRHRPEVNSVCHAHPPVATGYAAAGTPLNKALVCELIISLGCIPVAPYGTPGTPELAESIEPLDEVIEDKGVKVLIDPKAVLFLLGTEMDFKVDKLTSGFVFNNPNQTSACGCGESVAITPASPEGESAQAD